MKCEHDLSERETACADGMCPICLTAWNERLLAALEEICKVQNTYRSREQELAAMCLNQQLGGKE